MEELVEKAKYGDKEAYTELIRNVKQDLYKAAKHRISKEADIEDIIQDTTIVAYMKIKQLRDNKHFRAWIIKILNNECKKFYKNRKREEEINDKYISDRGTMEDNNFEEKLEFDNMIKDLSDTDKEIMKLYYEDNLSSREISKLLGININTIKSKISRGNKKIETSYKKVLMTILLCLIVTTGVVFGKEIINYLKSIFDLSSIGKNNDGVLSAIEDKEFVQNTEMDYIELSDGYKIRVDYLLMDDINMYMVFDLYCENGKNEYDRMSIVDLIIKNENGDTIYEQVASKGRSRESIEGWKRIESESDKNIKELNYIVSNGYPIVEKLNISFSEVVLYNDNASKNEKEIVSGNEINISIDVDEKFINRNVVEYVQEGTDSEYKINKAIITETGFYAIVETNNSEINFVIETSDNISYECSSRCLAINYTEEKYYHLILADIEKENLDSELILKNKYKNIKLNKK